MRLGKKYDAFAVAGTRLFVPERKTGKIFEIRGLPLGWRQFSDLIWADNRTLMFDRWSQPHYGIHLRSLTVFCCQDDHEKPLKTVQGIIL